MGKRKPGLDPEDVLAGRTKPSATDLLQLIRQENPTGRELGAAATEARYARKSRLQSLLVRRFADELTVTPDPAQPGIISLHHRGRDACHAVLSSLDEDARAWVQRELDLAASGSEEPAAEAPRARPPARGADETPDDTPEGLQARAEALLAEYDYEGAQRALEAALTRTGGAAGPAAALLGLLVDTLGDDAGVLAIAPRIDRAALADPRVRGPLALATARAGDPQIALGLLKGLDDAGAATVLAALATRALAAGDTTRAAEALEQARRRDPACTDLPKVVVELDKARAAAGSAGEAEATALLAAGRDDEAEARAREVLARWPGSVIARRVIAEVEDRRRAKEATRRAAEAEEALAHGETAVARALLAQAILAARGEERAALEARARRLDAAERERREGEQMEVVIRLLGAPDPRDGLTEYAALGEALREQVRARSPRPEVGWIDQMIAGGRAADRARAEAALAISAARAALGAADPPAALSLLAAHEAALDRVPEARRIRREAEAILEAAHLAEARAAVTRARDLLAAAAFAEALSLLGASSLRKLPAEERAEVEALRAAALRADDRRRRAEETARLRASGRLLDARRRAEALTDSADDEAERTRWAAEREAICGEVRRAFRIHVDDQPMPIEETRSRLWTRSIIDERLEWLTEDGRALVVVDAHERWVVVRVLDLTTKLVCPTVLLRLPEPLYSVSAHVSGSALWVVSDRGPVLEIDMACWDVRGFWSTAELAGPGRVMDSSHLVGFTGPTPQPHLWIRYRDPDPGYVHVIDLAQRRTVRVLDDVWFTDPVTGPGEVRALAHKDDSFTLHTARGVPVPGRRIAGDLGIGGLVAHPDGEGLLALAAPVRKGAEDQLNAKLASISAAGAVRMTDLPDVDEERQWMLTAVPETGPVYFLTRGVEGTTLFTFGLGPDGGLSLLSTAPVPAEAALVQDVASRHVVLVVGHEGGLDVAPLGEAPPVLPPRPRRPSITIPNRLDALSCGRAERLGDSETKRVWRNISVPELLNRVAEVERDESASSAELVEMLLAFRGDARPVLQAEAKLLAVRLLSRFPDDGMVRLIVADDAAEESRWADVRDLLARASTDLPSGGRARHFHHLQALAAVRTGHFDEAVDAVSAASAHGGRCNLDSLIELLAAVKEPTGAVSTLVAQHVAALRAADRCLAAGDPEGARAALEVPGVCRDGEVQVAARLAEAWLGLTPTSRADQLAKLAALGTLCDLTAGPKGYEHLDLPLPESWSAARITDVVSRARIWLDAFDPGA